MAFVDKEVCLKSNCPFVVKNNGNIGGMFALKGSCGRALILRRPKSQVCVSTVDIKIKKK